MKTVGTYQLPTNKEAIINEIVNSNADDCDFGNAAELLASTFEGDILISDYKEKTKTSPDVNDKLLQDFLGKKYIIDLPDPDTKTTTKNYKIGNYLVSFYVDVVRNTAGNYIINGKEYKPLVYDGSNGFAGFYDISILPSINKDENGKYLTDDLNAKGGWLLPASQFYEFKPYQPFLENTLAELQPNFLDSFESYWNILHKCTSTQLKAYENGIVPECFWKGVGNPNFAQLAGVIDETYRTGVSFGQFGKFVMPLSNIDDLLRDYLLGITCEDELWDNIKKIDKLEDEIRKLDYDSELINFVVDKWKNEQIETLAEDISACEEYIKFKKKVPRYADIVLNWDKWASGFDALHANIDKYVETFAKDLGNVGTLNDLQNYAIGKRMFEEGSIFATASGASPAEVGINTLKKLPKLPKNIPLRAIEHTATEVKVIAEGQTTSLFTVSKEGVYTSERWFTGTGAATKLDEVTNVHFMERGSSFKTGTIEFVEDANGEKWLKATTTASRYANYPNIQKLATHVLDELDASLWDDAILSSLESDLGKSTLKQALEGDLDLLYLWQTSKQTTLVNLTLLKNQLQKIGYSDFKSIDFLKNADGTYYGSKLIYADVTTTSDAIINASITKDDTELRFLEEICTQYSTKAYTPVSINQPAVDGILQINSEFIQLKSTGYSQWVPNVNSAYKSAVNNGYKNVELYVELKDMSVSQITTRWQVSINQNSFKIKNDGTISKFTAKATDGWVDLDLTLLK